jgi:hypothetical protein
VRADPGAVRRRRPAVRNNSPAELGADGRDPRSGLPQRQEWRLWSGKGV